MNYSPTAANICGYTQNSCLHDTLQPKAVLIRCDASQHFTAIAK